MKSILFLKIESNGISKSKVCKKNNYDKFPNCLALSYKIGKINNEKSKVDIKFGYYSVIKSDCNLNTYAQTVHKITKKEIDNGKDIKTVLKDLNDNILKYKVRIIIGHNINFDYNIIKAEFFRNDMELIEHKIQLLDLMIFNHEYKHPPLVFLYENLLNKKWDKNLDRKTLIDINIECFEKLYNV